VFYHTTSEEIYYHSLITPFQVIQVPDVPHTLNGKRVEVLVKKVGPTIHQYILSHFICFFFGSDYQRCTALECQLSHAVQPGVFEELSGHRGNPSPGN